MVNGFPSPVSDAELSHFCRQFATMLAADVSLLPVIVTLRQQTGNDYLRDILVGAQEELEAGHTLAVALSRYPEVFTPFFLQLVRQGEQDGALAEVLFRLADHYESEAAGSGGRASIGPVQIDIAPLLEGIRPMFVWVGVSLAFVAFAAASLWYATRAGMVNDREFGPNVLLTTGLCLLIIAAFFSRFRPRTVRRCSFCGRLDTEVEGIFASRGAAICNECVVKTVSQLRSRPHRRAAAAPLPAAPLSEREQRLAYQLRDANEPLDLDELAREETNDKMTE